MASLVLHLGRRDACPASFMAWLALREQGIAFEERDARALDAGKPSAWARTPLLIEDEAFVIFDAAAIMEYASDVGGRSLLPADPRARAQVRSVVAWQRDGAASVCPSVSLENSFAGRPQMLAPGEQRQLSAFLAMVEARLLASGGPYLFGPLSLADIAFVPALFRIFAAHPDMTAWKSAARWAARMLERSPVHEWRRGASRTG